VQVQQSLGWINSASPNGMGKRGHHVGRYDLNSHFSSYASRNSQTLAAICK
jgi:hypothetical protein